MTPLLPKLSACLFVLWAVLVYINWTFIFRKSNQQIDLKVVRIDGRHDIVPSSQDSTKMVYLDAHLPKQYDLRILAIVYNRADSLLRLLQSLDRVEYDNDSVRLEVWIDRSKNGSLDKRTFDTAKKFVFNHGSYSVNPHKTHVGIYGQWLSTWKPVLNSSEIAVIFEDDVTVSPFYYKYLKVVHKKYDSYPFVNGFSLQGLLSRHSDDKLLEGPEGAIVFLYPVVGTWGYSPSTKNWIKFIDWFSRVYQKDDFQPIVPGNIVSKWYLRDINNHKDGVWYMWYIYYAWKYNEYSLRPNFKDNRGLSANWYEKGLHFSGNDVRPSNPLLEKWKPEYENMPDKPVHLDISGKLVDRK